MHMILEHPFLRSTKALLNWSYTLVGMQTLNLEGDSIPCVLNDSFGHTKISTIVCTRALKRQVKYGHWISVLCASSDSFRCINTSTMSGQKHWKAGQGWSLNFDISKPSFTRLSPNNFEVYVASSILFHLFQSRLLVNELEDFLTHAKVIPKSPTKCVAPLLRFYRSRHAKVKTSSK